MSEGRRLDVLRAIVDDYVHSGDPVGSKALVERHQLGVSSATIRNDMAALEEEGLIAAPHTSSGRIPTDKGYRLFVDRIDEVKPLSAAEKRAIAAVLSGTHDVEDLLERTVRTLAQLTNQVAVVQFPLSSHASVRHIEVVQLAAHQVLLVLILDTGKVEQGVFDVGQQLSEAQVAILRALFLEHCGTQPVADLSARSEMVGQVVPPALRIAAQAIGRGLRSLAEELQEQRFVVAGTANLARARGDFPLSIGPVLDALEEQVVMLRLLSDMAQDSRGMAVSIGRENLADSLSETSVIAASYGAGDGAKLGVLGPLRMDYPSTMAAVRAVARYLSRILAG
ncbi:heat-inducible transcriptional repressor HrcA [Psychromicrobium xiongbiense]|uniref:heat-inducible transcriptional repressor HrcA n=1 Tax=Psychromicrobium xiongbiense TaxID=3051184 RepID=UPI002557243E|nr:heat-inducible transcriptional repressor HrcA [Psychromicrobium sp. YIM S02556]